MADPAIERKGPDAKLLGRTRATVDNRANSMAAQLRRWLERMARFEARQEIAALMASQVVATSFKSRKVVLADQMLMKAETTRAELEQQLRRILQTNGRSMATAATRRTLGDRKADVTDAAMAAFMRTKDIRLQQIMAQTRAAVKESVRQVILTALAEVPRPSTGEIARRIRTLYHGNVGGIPEIDPETGQMREIPAPLINSRVLPTSRVRTDKGGNLYVFSSERAALIARTEMAQAENTGIVNGYEQAGVEYIMWLAYRDGRSGDREHDEMHGVIIRLGEMFVLPDGTRTPYPGWYRLTIKHLANCRCTTRPVLGP